MTRKLKLCILIDNSVAHLGVRSSWGLSIVGTYSGVQFLFDVGPSFSILRHNAEVLGVDLERIEFVVISHWHGDHSGALSDFVREYCRSCRIYVPPLTRGSIIPEGYIQVREAMEIVPGVYTTGPISVAGITEQSLVLRTAHGACVLTGCSHPGLLKILEVARRVSGQNVHAVIGGFHGFGFRGAEREEFLRFIEENDTRVVCPCHCSGEYLLRFLEKVRPDVLISGGVGRIMEFTI